MDVRKLSHKSFRRQMFSYGFLSEQIPECFSSKSFGRNTYAIIEHVRKSVACAPTTMSTFKRGASRRIIAIPNPYAFANTVKFMGENWDLLKKHAHSENSLSRIMYLRSYHSGVAEALNNEPTRVHYKSKSSLVRNAKSCMASALGFRYRLKVDISSCYDSIDVHSVLWAMFGRKNAERYMVAKAPDNKRAAFDFGKQMAKSVANQNSKNTRGIITGPYTSRIFSEVVLAGIDEELRRRLGERFPFAFRRYVDDYRFFFKTETETNQALEVIEEVLDGYGLKLNHGKTSVDIYPFDYMKPMRRRFEEAYDEDGMGGLLNEAAVLHNEGMKGAFKYALKMAKSRELDPQEAELVLALLFNINLTCPECSKYVAAVIEANRECFMTERLSTVVSQQLVQDLQRKLDQEALNSIFFVKYLGLTLPARALIEVFNTGCDPAVIMALDLWRNHRDQIQATPYETRLVNAARRDLERRLAGESMDGEHWMLLYEAYRHGLLRKVAVDKGYTAPFFETLDAMDVDFYIC